MCLRQFTRSLFILLPMRERMLLCYHRRCGNKLTRYSLHIKSLLRSFVIHRLPFDWHCPFGYFIAVCVHLVMVWHEIMIAACVISFAFGCYLLGIAMSESIKDSLLSIDRSIGDKTDENLILDQLVEFIELHSTAKQLRAPWLSNFTLHLEFYSFFPSLVYLLVFRSFMKVS